MTQSGVRWCDVTSMQTSGILSVALGEDSSREELSGYGARMLNSPLPPIDTPSVSMSRRLHLELVLGMARKFRSCTLPHDVGWSLHSVRSSASSRALAACSGCWFLWNCCGRNPAVRDTRSAFVVEVGCGRCRRRWDLGRCRSAWRSWWLQTPAHLVDGGLDAARWRSSGRTPVSCRSRSDVRTVDGFVKYCRRRSSRRWRSCRCRWRSSGRTAACRRGDARSTGKYEASGGEVVKLWCRGDQPTGYASPRGACSRTSAVGWAVASLGDVQLRCTFGSWSSCCAGVRVRPRVCRPTVECAPLGSSAVSYSRGNCRFWVSRSPAVLLARAYAQCGIACADFGAAPHGARFAAQHVVAGGPRNGAGLVATGLPGAGGRSSSCWQRIVWPSAKKRIFRPAAAAQAPARRVFSSGSAPRTRHGPCRSLR